MIFIQGNALQNTMYVLINEILMVMILHQPAPTWCWDIIENLFSCFLKNNFRPKGWSSHNGDNPTLRDVAFPEISFIHHTLPIWMDGIWYYAWWHHSMGTFSVLLAQCEGNPSVAGVYPSQKASNAQRWYFPFILEDHWTNSQFVDDFRGLNAGIKSL